ncbi:MAG: type 1 glutamine amidotransferase [Ktedonobacteraceae bacterium]|nr:type 1 glutamine amidotransferase [Ktedonobacteraceae bacterium]
MKRILMLQHIGENSGEYIDELLHGYDVTYDPINVGSDPLPNPRDYDAIVAFGGSQHVYEATSYTYFAEEIALIRRAVAEDIPFLGICLGGQLLAHTLGGIVKKHVVSEIGFYIVQLTEEGKQDPLYAGLPGYQKVFHWHEDVFDLADDSILLATTAETPNQAFRYGHRAYGLQYHIEITPELLHSWLREVGPEEDTPDLARIRALESLTQSEFVEYQEHTRIIFRNFLRISGII